MSLFKGPPKPLPPANVPVAADASINATPVAPSAGSLISTTAQGLTRKAKTQKTSLIGG